ncbi:transglycosylase domain-containing protein [uncultured Ruminococcus sp.]|uniref:transglycosylase domain-containing protein n=1 Tax=uncultured Ruminococcus sp. TaxID=165186 RepID=UPI00292E75F6|nr:transglycosylase domain-containing protein [uncultured Ruminococcus sp.]
MRKTDISKYTDKIDVPPKKKQGGFKGVMSVIGRCLLTVLAVLVVAGVIVGISIGMYIMKIANEPTGIDLNARSLNLSSFIYVENPTSGEFEEYQTLYGTENRIWVDMSEMPKAMGQAIVAIEDKRFYEHHGVDWYRTGSAVLSLITGRNNYGGSTLTQQLIKNITDDSEVSLTRKVREIFRALNIEREYSKEDILEAYLNVVNFGNNCQGVESASELYFDKPIGECSIAQCAAIAGITQNPSRWNPLLYPENNKERRETVLQQMYEQEMITKEEYDAAMKESATMTFVGGGEQTEEEEEEDNIKVQNWYIDQMYYDLCRDLAKFYDISEDAASLKLYTEGLKIYCAMDTKAQQMIEEEALKSNAEYDYDLQTAMTMVGYDGRVIATVGSSKEKEGNLDWDRASHSVLQPGSSIKAIIPYPIAINTGVYNYSTLATDQPIEKWKENSWGGFTEGPPNAYDGYFQYMTVPEALAWSSNAAAVQTMELIGTKNAYKFATEELGFSHLAEADKTNVGALSLGGMEGGVTVREMAAAMEYIGNGGLYYEPYTYYYVTDQNDTIILDNRNNTPVEAFTPETAYKMNRLLKYNVMTSTHTASHYAAIEGWDIAGKTGTTDYDRDLWFVGASPYCTLACWMGYDQPESVNYYGLSTIVWQKVMSNYLADKPYKEFTMPDTIIAATYCKGSGMLASSWCSDTATGYYTKDDMPDYCDGTHLAGSLGGNKPIQTETYAPVISSVETPTGGGEEPVISGGGEEPVVSGGGEEPVVSGGGEEPVTPEPGGGETPEPGGGDEPVVTG